jgi:hypothetical protein
VREALQQLDERRSDEARPIPGPRLERLKEAQHRLEEQNQVGRSANAAFDHHRKVGRDSPAGGSAPEEAAHATRQPARDGQYDRA